MQDGGRQGGAATFQIPTGNVLPDPALPVTGDVVAGVVDTGVVVLAGQPHPYLAANLADGWAEQEDVLPPPGEPLGRYDGHGTFVAGLIKKEAPAVRLDVRRALDWDPDGGARNDAQVAAQIRQLAAVPGLRVLNLSFFGAAEAEAEEPAEIRDALADLLDRVPEVLVVAAAANRWTGAKSWPAAFKERFGDRVIAVGAVDESVTPVPGLLPPRAAFCSQWDGIDVFAGGSWVLGPAVRRRAETPMSAFEPDVRRWAENYANGAGTTKLRPEPPERDEFAFGLWSGTSFAAARVTGLLAQAALDGAGTAAAARAAVLTGALPRIPLPGQAPKPCLTGAWPLP